MDRTPVLDDCRLCGTRAALQRSHLMPRFVVNYLKRTSATGLLITAENPERPVQDGLKPTMFCSDCEQLLGKAEQSFATNVFHPRHNAGSPIAFRYDGQLSRFVVGLAIRCALSHFAVGVSPSFAQNDALMATRQQSDPIIATRAIPGWRRFLLEDTPHPGPYRFHMIQTDYIIGGHPQPPPELQWYLMRAADMTVTYSVAGQCTLLIVIPGFIFFVPIVPKRATGWFNTRIARQGSFDPDVDVRIGPSGMLEYIAKRAVEIGEKCRSLSPGAIDSRSRRLRRNLERAKSSESLRAFLAAEAIKVR